VKARGVVQVTAFGNLGNSLEALRLLGNRLTSLQAGNTHINPAFELSNGIRAAVGLDILNALMHILMSMRILQLSWFNLSILQLSGIQYLAGGI
jgi:hypothetical protein